MLAIGNGAKKEVLERIQRWEPIFWISSAGWRLCRLEQGCGDVTPGRSSAAASLPGVAVAVPESDGTVVVRYGNKDLQYRCRHQRGISRCQDWPLQTGVFFTSADITATAWVALGSAWRRSCSPMRKARSASMS